MFEPTPRPVTLDGRRPLARTPRSSSLWLPDQNEAVLRMRPAHRLHACVGGSCAIGERLACRVQGSLRNASFDVGPDRRRVLVLALILCGAVDQSDTTATLLAPVETGFVRTGRFPIQNPSNKQR